MPTVLLIAPPELDPPTLVGDLLSAGVDVPGPAAAAFRLRDVMEAAPDLVVVHDPAPGEDLFAAITALNETAPRPVLVFTAAADAGRVEQAVRSGVHAFVVDGYSRGRLRGLLQLAQARFRHEQMLRDELAVVKGRFAERRLVDRARGILMNTRRLREDEAYAALRTAAMHTKQRIGQVAQQVIDGAALAESVNRAGQLRMLSQRLVKLYALCCTGTRAAESAALLSDSAGQVEANLLLLGRTLPRDGFGRLLEAVVEPWRGLRRAVALPADPARVGEADALAEEMLVRAEALTEQVEVAGFVVALRAVNVSGRQRMLSQRYAKMKLLGAEAGSLASVRGRIEESMGFLLALPMTNPPIATELAEAREHWTALQALSADERDGIAAVSEALLACYERLTDHLERAVQVLAG